jgi:predicted RNA-binding protein (virulence factor B family)
MIELGKIQTLEIIRKTSIGLYLNSQDDRNSDDILLPNNQVPEEIKIGDPIEVFVYKDSEDRMIATVRRPKLTIGELGLLQVVEITKIGAFLDWGLEKDLFLPFGEQRERVIKGKKYLVGLYIDNSRRLCATMKIANLLGSESPYKVNDRVQGTIYSINPELGAFVAVNDRYHGLIPVKEWYDNYTAGDRVEVRIKKVHPDGKLELSLRANAKNEIGGDAAKIMERLTQNGGALPLDDHSAPERIKAELSMSKAAFKRAVGRLLKEGAIKITDKGLERMW